MEEEEEEATVVVGLDMGTTFSGFAFAHKDDPDDISTFSEWPGGEGKPYCKTQTSLCYQKTASGEFALIHWGWPAQARHFKEMQDEGGERSHFLTNFKLHLAPRQAAFKDPSNAVRRWRSGRDGTPRRQEKMKTSTAPPLPVGLSVVRAITDYLAELSAFAVSQVQETYGEHITPRDVQWCLTVPAIWDDSAKQTMRKCAQMAGMVTGPHCPPELAAAASPLPLRIVLEPEAASAYCVKYSKQLLLHEGDRFVVADLGGGTTEIVVHTKESEDDSELRLRETSQSSGDLCGGTDVDRNFQEFLSRRTGCLEECVRQDPACLTPLLKSWADIKVNYDGGSEKTSALDLPKKLSRAWRLQDIANASGRVDQATNYDEIVLTRADMMQIFDPVVDRIVELIRDQLTRDTKLLLLVGGFSMSPYVRRRVKDAFADVLDGRIVIPPDPGGAACKGAVIFGRCPRLVTSRVSRKTYGVELVRAFIPESDPWEYFLETDQGEMCANSFRTFVSKGQHVAIDYSVKQNILPVEKKQTSLSVGIFSSHAAEVHYTTDPGLVFEGEFEVDISDDPENLDLERKLEVSMYFGTSCIQVQGRRLNFGNKEEVIEMHNSIGFELEEY